MKLFLSVHDDDNSLFGAFTCIREKPHVSICLSSWIQPNRGEAGCSADERFAESVAACEILDCTISHLPIRDDNATQEMIERELLQLAPIFDVVYAPALQGGNVHHDMVARAAVRVFGDKVSQYTTYTKTELYTTGDIEIVPKPVELELKAQALACYTSQLRINRAHFDAVMGRSEWLMK